MLATFWPVLIYGQAAIVNIEPQLLDVSRVLRLSTVGRVTKVVLPATLPRYFVAFRLATAVSLIVAVTVEIAANPLGIGYELMTTSRIAASGSDVRPCAVDRHRRVGPQRRAAVGTTANVRPAGMAELAR